VASTATTLRRPSEVGQPVHLTACHGRQQHNCFFESSWRLGGVQVPATSGGNVEDVIGAEKLDEEKGLSGPDAVCPLVCYSRLELDVFNNIYAKAATSIERVSGRAALASSQLFSFNL